MQKLNLLTFLLFSGLIISSHNIFGMENEKAKETNLQKKDGVPTERKIIAAQKLRNGKQIITYEDEINKFKILPDALTLEIGDCDFSQINPEELKKSHLTDLTFLRGKNLTRKFFENLPPTLQLLEVYTRVDEANNIDFRFQKGNPKPNEFKKIMEMYDVPEKKEISAQELMLQSFKGSCLNMKCDAPEEMLDNSVNEHLRDNAPTKNSENCEPINVSVRKLKPCAGTNDEMLKNLPKDLTELDLSKCDITGSCFKSLSRKLKTLILKAESLEKINKAFLKDLPESVTVKVKKTVLENLENVEIIRPSETRVHEKETGTEKFHFLQSRSQQYN